MLTCFSLYLMQQYPVSHSWGLAHLTQHEGWVVEKSANSAAPRLCPLLLALPTLLPLTLDLGLALPVAGIWFAVREKTKVLLLLPWRDGGEGHAGNCVRE